MFYQRLKEMNSYLKVLIKLLILLVVVLISVTILIFSKVLNFNLEGIIKTQSTQSQERNNKEPSTDEIKKINDSINQREDRIKALKEVGKKLGG
jgi:anionic cell wall polymer biosynthesis LytR-Cps2A-Psr (LCP) family protein